MRPGEVVALGYRYPDHGRLEILEAATERDLNGMAQRRMRRFVAAIGRLSLVEWEELHTRTLDLSPLFAPYVGHLIWGENYRRGEFMADLKRHMERHGVDLGGELPDHIEPVLRYLAVAPDPLSDLVEVIGDAVGAMRTALRNAEPENPYRHLIGATVAVIGSETHVSLGGPT